MPSTKDITTDLNPPLTGNGKLASVQEKIDQYKNECGCSLGAKTMSAVFLVYGIVNYFQYGLFTAAFLKHLPFLLLITFLGAVAGKLAGIAYARFKLKQLQKTNYQSSF